MHFTTIRKTEQNGTNFRLGLLEIVYHALCQVLAFEIWSAVPAPLKPLSERPSQYTL